MCHVCEFICYLCMQLNLKINTRSLSIQALKSAHQSLLSSRCWPWGVFSSRLASRDLGTARSSYLVRVGPMVRDMLLEASAFVRPIYGALRPISISNKISYRNISQSLEAARFVFRVVWSLWNLTGTLAALLLMCLSQISKWFDN